MTLLTGEFDEAYRLAQESMSLDAKLGHTEGVAQSLINMGLARLGQESLAEALELLSDGLSLAQQVDYKELIAAALEGLAGPAAAHQKSSKAKSLLQEADHLRERSGHVRGSLERRIYDETLERLQNLQEDAAGTPQ